MSSSFFILFLNLFFILEKRKEKKKDSYYKTITITSPSISLNLGTNIYDFERK